MAWRQLKFFNRWVIDHVSAGQLVTEVSFLCTRLTLFTNVKLKLLIADHAYVFPMATGAFFVTYPEVT